MKSVALVGMGDTWELALDADVDEIWTINYYYEMPGIVPDRVFDIHDLYWYRDSADKIPKHKYHWLNHLMKEKDFRFYAPLEYPDVPGAEVYPIHEVAADLLSGFWRATDDDYILVNQFFTSSFDYIMALAIHEGFERIELYGWSMGWFNSSETEYKYQLPGLAFWTGLALGRGINVILDKDVDVFKSRMYCFGGYDMVTRQTLETFRKAWEFKLQERQAQFHTAQGTFKTFMELAQQNPEKEAYRNSLKAKQIEVNEAFKNLIHAEGALGMVEHLIKDVDLEETDVEIESHMIGIMGQLELDGRGGKEKWEKLVAEV